MAERFRNLPRFHFLVRRAAGEGSVSQALRTVNIGAVDAGRYPDDAQIAVARRQLRQRDGFPVATLLAEIQDGRIAHAINSQTNEHAILEEDAANRKDGKTQEQIVFQHSKGKHEQRRKPSPKGQRRRLAERPLEAKLHG